MCKAYERKVNIERGTNNFKLPSTVTEIRKAGGPPTPLILNGWAFSTDENKKNRWEETIKWAHINNLEDIILNVDEKDKFYGDGMSNDDILRYISIHDEFTIDLLKKFNIDVLSEKGSHLKNYIKVSDYQHIGNEVLNSIPCTKGIYFVISEYGYPENGFLPVGTGGHFKGKDPNVDVEILWQHWVEDATILYIGRAGGTTKNGRVYTSTLKERIKALVEFGYNHPIGHWGGRYLWQHEDSINFKIYWFSMNEDKQNPVDLERELITQFKTHYGKRPFANLL